MNKPFLRDKVCVECATPFRTANTTRKTCSYKCSAEHRKKTVRAATANYHAKNPYQPTGTKLGRTIGKKYGPTKLAGSLKGSVVLSAVDEAKLKDAQTRAVADEAARRGK